MGYPDASVQIGPKDSGLILISVEYQPAYEFDGQKWAVLDWRRGVCLGVSSLLPR
jgi:hypothetical protein